MMVRPTVVWYPDENKDSDMVDTTSDIADRSAPQSPTTATTQLTPVVKVTSTQTVVQQLLGMIRSGVWKAGDPIPSEKELGGMLGVGRSTVREAIQNLSAINVLETSAGQRGIVKSPSPGEIFRAELVGLLINDSSVTELLEMRAIIEPDCARLAAERGSDDSLDEIAVILTAHRAAHKAGQSVAEFGAGFHVGIARATGNRAAAAFMESILDLLMERGRRADEIRHMREREIAEHVAIFDLIRSRQADAAKIAMGEHILSWADTYRDPAGEDAMVAE